jgi:hypothetical protein
MRIVGGPFVLRTPEPKIIAKIQRMEKGERIRRE